MAIAARRRFLQLVEAALNLGMGQGAAEFYAAEALVRELRENLTDD